MNLASYTPLVALGISFLALFVATRNFWRKVGVHVRGAFAICSSRACNDRYVGSITLENLKDRAVTIFSIHLRLGYNYYVQVEDFEDTPLILKPYETYQKVYGPIEFYGINSNRIDLNELFKSTKVKKRLVLSTSDGKYKVRPTLRHWSPITEFFSNHMTAVIRPVQSSYKGTFLGGNSKFVVEFVNENGTVEVVPIQPMDYSLKLFRSFTLTKESLESKESLKSLLQLHFESGKLHCKSFEVHDLSEWRKEAHDFYSGKTIQAKHYGAFHYYVLGKLLSRYSDWKLKRENRSRVAITKSQNELT